ncbi:hypothetical protein DPMN_187947 [Dreissena polymorpha]|uniref:Uncharacterized protein n=1 Tax=Dreissena polymorpha TaxID=45954 RepID=A0A9D4IAW6_DREPO|nr:hypothetical protein DPMN_187947 [Dreissena polymorpha]
MSDDIKGIRFNSDLERRSMGQKPKREYESKSFCAKSFRRMEHHEEISCVNETCVTSKEAEVKDETCIFRDQPGELVPITTCSDRMSAFLGHCCHKETRATYCTTNSQGKLDMEGSRQSSARRLTVVLAASTVKDETGAPYADGSVILRTFEQCPAAKLVPTFGEKCQVR